MRNKLDLLDVRIIEGLGKYGPRNLSEVARRLRMSKGTLLYRMKRMSSLFYLRMSANVYHTNLGLKKAVVFAEATPGSEELLFNCMKVNKFYIYLSRCYGKFEGCLGIYVIPKDKTMRFKQFIQEITKLGVVKRVEHFWSTCFHTVNRTTNWFDATSEKWIFPWDTWIEEIPNQPEDLPYTLIDPKDFPIKADETDLFIMKELEKDATVPLSDIARKLGMTLQNVHYHYKMHLLKKGLIEAFQIAIMPFDRAVSDAFFFRFKFDNWKNLAKFARALLDKSFVYIVGKILNENAIVSQVYLPRLEFRNFVESLSKLTRAGYLQSYDYVIQDFRPGQWSRETIPYKFFKDGSWKYNHYRHIKELRELMKSA